MYRYALTGREVVAILMQRHVKVDGKVHIADCPVVSHYLLIPNLPQQRSWQGSALEYLALANSGAKPDGDGKVTGLSPAARAPHLTFGSGTSTGAQLMPLGDSASRLHLLGGTAHDSSHSNCTSCNSDYKSRPCADGDFRSAQVRTDATFPAGFMDVIEIAKTGEQFRLVYDTKGRFVVHRISPEEASYKLAKVRLLLPMLQALGSLSCWPGEMTSAV